MLLSGEVVEVNEELLEHPEWINQSPYELGWIVKVKPSNMEEFNSLMTNEQYNKFIGEIENKKRRWQRRQILIIMYYTLIIAR